MKTNKWLVVLLALLFAMVINVPASTNSVAAKVATTVSNVASNVTDTVTSAATAVKGETVTNINQAVVSILMGAKSVGSDLYSASKDAIHNSIDFVSTQAPDVVRQFIVWHLCENLVFYGVWLLVGFAFWFVSYRAYRYMTNSLKRNEHWNDDDRGGNMILRWILMVIGLFIILVDTCNYGAQALKIAVAPKLYILEYIVDIVKSHGHVAL